MRTVGQAYNYLAPPSNSLNSLNSLKLSCSAAIVDASFVLRHSVCCAPSQCYINRPVPSLFIWRSLVQDSRPSFIMFAKRSQHSESFSKHRAARSTSKAKRSFRENAAAPRKTSRPTKPDSSPGTARYDRSLDARLSMIDGLLTTFHPQYIDLADHHHLRRLRTETLRRTRRHSLVIPIFRCHMPWTVSRVCLETGQPPGRLARGLLLRARVPLQRGLLSTTAPQ